MRKPSRSMKNEQQKKRQLNLKRKKPGIMKQRVKKTNKKKNKIKK